MRSLPRILKNPYRRRWRRRIAQQRAAIQKQAAAICPPSRLVQRDAAVSSFFTIPFPPLPSGHGGLRSFADEQLDPLIEAAAQKTGVEAQLVRAVIDRESAGRPCALSAKGAQGLMQLMPETADQFEVDDPFDPKQNVEAGAKLLKSLLERYKNDPSLALGAYNAGSERVDQAGGVPPIPETVDYVTAILGKLNSWNNKAESSAAAATKNAGW